MRGRRSVYYLPRPVGSADLALMRAIDEPGLDYPFAGARMLGELLTRRGFPVGRKRVARLMRRMGIAPVGRSS